MAYESWIFRGVTLAQKRAIRLPAQYWALSTAIETAVPAFAVGFLTTSQIDAAVSAPRQSSCARLFYFHNSVHIALEPLDLHSLRCSGERELHFCSPASWLAISNLRCPRRSNTSNRELERVDPVRWRRGRAGVCREIRKHLLAALREVETKRKLSAIQHDLQVARSIQQSLLPSNPPQIAGFEIGGWNCPADDTGGTTSIGIFFRMAIR